LFFSFNSFSQLQHQIYKDIVNNKSQKTFALLKKILITNTNPDTIEIKVFTGKISKTLGGEFEKVFIRLENAEFKNLNVESAVFILYNPIIDLDKLWNNKQIVLKNNEKVDFSLTINEKDLNDFLLKKKDDINVDSPSVKLYKEKISLTGKGKILSFNVRFRADGKFNIRENHYIDFIPNNLKFNSIPLPKLFIRRLVKKINPVLNMYDFPFNLRIEKIVLLDGKIIFSAGIMK